MASSYKYTGYQSDKYYLNKDELNRQGEMFGSKAEPVDINAACIKDKQGNGLQGFPQDEIQYNIRERFGVCSVDDNNPDTYGENDQDYDDPESY